MSLTKIAALLVALLSPLTRDNPGPLIPCSVVVLRNNPEGYHWPLANIKAFVAEAEVIIRAVPRSVVAGAQMNTGLPFVTAGALRFKVIETLRGKVAGDTIDLPGNAVTVDDFNKGAVPYRLVRSAGQRGDCLAREYKIDAEYLLLLKTTPTGLSPYWAPLAPFNEQIRGIDDGWLKWVRAEMKQGG